MAAPSILLLDDEPMLREITASMLARRGAEVCVARRLEDAILVARARPYELAIIDLASTSPTATEAVTALRAIGHAPGRFVVCCEPGRVLGSDDVDVLDKPFDFGRLVDLVFRRPMRRGRSRSGTFPVFDASLHPRRLARGSRG